MQSITLILGRFIEEASRIVGLLENTAALLDYVGIHFALLKPLVLSFFTVKDFLFGETNSLSLV